MNLRNIKFFLGVLFFLTYTSIGVFGLFKFSHMDETPMVNCPYAQNSYAICENSFNHIDNWQQFTNVTLTSLFVFSTLVFGMIFYFFGKQNFLNQKIYFYKWKYYLDNKILYSFPNKIIKWLSLFENSPSFSFMA